MSGSSTVTRSASLRKRVTALLASTAMLVAGGISLAVAPGANAEIPLACDSGPTQKITLAPSEVLSLALDPATCGTAAVPASGYFGVGTVWLHVVTPSGIQHLSAGESVANASYDWVRFVAPSTVQAAAVQFTVGSVSFEIAVVAPATVPGAPQSLTATGGASKIDLAWSAPASDGGSGVTGYRIDVSDKAASGPFAPLFDASPSDLTYSHTGLADGVTRWYRIYAINVIGTSATSAEATATTAAVPGTSTLPGAPAKGGVVAIPGGLVAAWVPPLSDGGSPVTGYRADMSSEGPNSGFTAVAAPNVSTYNDVHYFTLSGLSAGVQHWFRIYTITSAGQSVDFLAATGTAGAPTVPGTPASALAVGGPGKITLTWEPPLFYENGGLPLTYTVRRSDTGSWTGFESSVAGLTDLSYTETGLAANQQVWFKVYAVNSLGESVAYQVTDAATAPVAPDAPASGTATGGSNKVDLAWAAPANDGGSIVTGYRIDVSGTNSSESFTPLVPLQAGRDYSDTGLGAGQTRYYRVFAINGQGASSNFLALSATATTPVVPTPVGGGSSSPAADSGSGSSEPAVTKPVAVPVTVPVLSTLLPAAATTLIRQTARITAPSSRGLAVGTRVVLAAKPVKTSAGVTVRWSRTKASAGVCSVATVGGRAVATLLKPGACRVVGTAAAPSRDYAVFQATRTYRVR